ncbi:MAG: GGDEF domain-containing protein, partial [Peptostreptococcaceae bacterium]
VYGYLAECYAKEGNYTNYKMYRDKCIELANKIDDVKSQVWIYSTSAGLELEFSNLDTAKVYLNKAQSMYDKSEEYIYSQNTDVVLNFVKSKIDYFEHKNYTETLSKYIDNLDVLDSRGVKSDIYSVITNEILNISLENDDLKTYKKYSVNINYDEKKLSQAYIDSMYTELNNNIKEKQLFKEKIKTHVLLILSIVSIYDLINNKKKNKKINKLNTKLREMNVLDPLTNLYNRGYLIETFGEIQNREDTITFIMIDIDYFKLYNDNYGHIKGDQVLIRVSEIIKSVFKDDMVFRYGGEEFSIISTKKLEDIIKYLDELKSKLHNENIIHEYSEVSDRVTLSIGLTSNKVCTENDAIQITKLADENLYKSKKKGRDRYTY